MFRDINARDLVSNPSPRLPVALCLDVSRSMSGRPITELNRGVLHFFADLNRDLRTKYSAEVAVVTFASGAAVIHDFTTGADLRPLNLSVDQRSTGTSLGSGVETALKLLEHTKALYKKRGLTYYQPWLVVMTDGQPTDDSHLRVQARVREMVEHQKLTVIAAGIGSHADLQTLSGFSPNGLAFRLDEVDFRQFFRFLVQSAHAVSSSGVVGNAQLGPDLGQIMGWKA